MPMTGIGATGLSAAFPAQAAGRQPQAAAARSGSDVSGVASRFGPAFLPESLVAPHRGIAVVIAASVPLMLAALLFSSEAHVETVIPLAATLAVLAVVVALPARETGRDWLVAPLLAFAVLVAVAPAALETNYLLLLLYWNVSLAAYFLRPSRFLVVACATASLHGLSLRLFPVPGLSMLEWLVTMIVLAVPAFLVWTLHGAVNRLDRLAAGLLESAAEPLVLVDERMVVVSANRLFSELSGYGVSKLEGQMLCPSVGNGGQLMTLPTGDGLAFIETSAGDRVPVSVRRAGEVAEGARRRLQLLLVTDERERVEEALSREAALEAERSERQHLERVSAVLAREAEEDRLTGLLNRRGLARRFAGLRAEDGRAPNRIVAVVLDLDDFKHLNDTFGHVAGDHVLQAAAGRLADGTRERDIVARYGGDEFVAVLQDVPPGSGAEFVERLRASVARPVIVTSDGKPCEIPLRVSAGLAVARVGDVTLDELIREADLSLYRAKRAGGNQICDRLSGCAQEALAGS